MTTEAAPAKLAIDFFHRMIYARSCRKVKILSLLWKILEVTLTEQNLFCLAHSYAAIMNADVANFCRQVRARSSEHQRAIQPLIAADCIAVAVGLLRQELDSLIRVAYICHHTADSPLAISLMQDSVSGSQWTTNTRRGGTRRITDREMLDLAAQVGGWEPIVYSFGCKLIHLSNFHDHATVDPFTNIPRSATTEIIQYLHQYHQYPDSDIDTQRFIEYLPKVMQKLTGNVLHYISDIETRNAS